MPRDASLGTVIQPQWNTVPIFGPHIATTNLANAPVLNLPQLPDRVFNSNESIWAAIIAERVRAHMVATLRGFHVFEWFPRAPGLFHTPEASNARLMADIHLDNRFPQRSGGKHTNVFLPEGKASMLEGGIGCVRLKPLEDDGKVLWWMTASSNGVAHEGFPIAVSHPIYEQHIDEIAKRGSVKCNLVGRLRFLPEHFAHLYRYAGVPQVFLEVEELDRVSQRVSGAKEVSVAVSFLGHHRDRDGLFATYVTFKPGRKGSFQRSIDWMKGTYVEGLYDGQILTDFDQVNTHFPEAKLSLRKLMGKLLQDGEVQEAIALIHAAGIYDGFLSQLDLEQLRQRSAKLARTTVFISYSRLDKAWMDRVRVHLKPLVREHSIDDWADDRIDSGSDWRIELDNAIESARVAILLISANFMASDFIQQYELPKLLAAAARHDLVLLPIVLSASAYSDSANLQRYQAVNDSSRPLVTLSQGEQEMVLDRLRTEVYRSMERLLRTAS